MENTKNSLQVLQDIIEQLIGPNGCPWDKKQTPESLADYLIEETHELVSAIRKKDFKNICEELGDVSFLLLFIAKLFENQNKFKFSDALEINKEKMIRRHPHVFGEVKVNSESDIISNWEAIKKEEHKSSPGDKGVFASLPDSLPPLIKAYRIHSKAARNGFTWKTDEEVEQQVEAEWLELLDATAQNDNELQKHELGDLIFSIVELGRRKGIKANEALDLATMRFLKRFKNMEEMAKKKNKDISELSFDEQNELWEIAKSM